jgi:hypothetical protein
MHLAEECISILWPWVQYAESDPQDYRMFEGEEVQALQLDLLRVIEMLRLAAGATKES